MIMLSGAKEIEQECCSAGSSFEIQLQLKRKRLLKKIHFVNPLSGTR